MGKLVVTEFVSVDGVLEDPGGAENYEHGGWTFEYDRGDAGNTFKLEELMEAEVQLFGRVTYEGFAAPWPSREGEFADRINRAPKYVVSTTLKEPEWHRRPASRGGDWAIAFRSSPRLIATSASATKRIFATLPR
jgi:hypothetical protein